MNKLDTDDGTRIVAALVEGNSMRAVSRMTGVARNTINKLLVDSGRACSEFQDKTLRNLLCKRVECDEIWSFIGPKEKNCTAEMKVKGAGDMWTWVALDPESKLVPCWFVGERHAGCAYHFLSELKGRLAHPVQLTTDGRRAYLHAVEDVLGTEIDFAMLQKLYGNAEQCPKTQYSPAVCTAAREAVITCNPHHAHISTSYVERQNLTMRMSMRRFTHLTTSFSKKVENHEHILALHYMYYNFARIHQSLRVTPAMEARISDHVWSIDEIISLLHSN